MLFYFSWSLILHELTKLKKRSKNPSCSGAGVGLLDESPAVGKSVTALVGFAVGSLVESLGNSVGEDVAVLSHRVVGNSVCSACAGSAL